MNTLARALAATILLVVLASCGAEDDGADPGEGAAADAPSSSTPTSAADDSVTSVTLRRSGGMKGNSLTRSFTVDGQPPSGFTAAEQGDVLRVAQDLVDSGITLEELPDNTCCDRYTYVVVIGKADGSSTTYNALDGEPHPKVFEALLAEVSRS